MKRQLDSQMHSAEHILNQTMVRLYDCGRCFTAHIGRKKSKCDFRFDHTLTGEEVAEIQSRVNRVIDADLPITESFVSRDEAESLYNTQKLPKDVGVSIRIVHMGEYDSCPCIGEHVASTGDVGKFKITTTSYADGDLRIRFKLSG